MLLRNIFKKLIVGILVAVIAICIMPINSVKDSNVYASVNEPVVIVLDPGHGGSDCGANSYNTKTMEADINWKIAVELEKYLNQYENVVVYKTRDNYTTTMGLGARVNFVESVGADLCVSLHNNSGGGSGTEVYKSIVEPFSSNTNQMCLEIMSNLTSLGFRYRGVKTRRSTLSSTPDDDWLTMLCGPISVGIPSILIEHGFVDNAHDANILKSKYKEIAQADGRAIVNYFNLKKKGDGPTTNPTLEVTPYMQSYGFMATQPNGMIAGFSQYRKGDHRDKRLEGFKIALNNEGYSGNVLYNAYIQGQGWSGEVANNQFAGTQGEAKAVEAIKVRLDGEMEKFYDIYYRVCSGDKGWTGWAKNGNPAGRVNFNSKTRAIQVKLVLKGEEAPGSTSNAYEEMGRAPEDAKVAYYTHVQTYGWEKEEAYDGKTSGTTHKSKRLESISIRNNTKIEGDIEYQVHCQTYGWMNYVKNGKYAGTEGEGKRLEAIKIRLTGKLKETYDVYYRVHAQTYGWLDWAKNDEPAGTSTYGKRLEAIEIQFVKKGDKAPGNVKQPYISPLVSYRTHVQTFGWQKNVKDGEVSGTSGLSKRLEGIIIENNTGLSGGFEYQVHCQTYSWLPYVKDGQMAGTEGQSKRLEAIRIKLYGELAEKYDVYYKVHCQTYGWLDWAKNGESAGSEGLAKRLEAIQIVLVKKGGKAPGETTTCFINNGISLNSEIATDLDATEIDEIY